MANFRIIGLLFFLFVTLSLGSEPHGLQDPSISNLTARSMDSDTTAQQNATGQSDATVQSNATAGSNTTSPDENIVTGPKALWPLVTLGLTTIIQPSRADAFPSEVGLSPARTSPVISAADLLVSVIWMVFGIWKGLGVRGSACLLRSALGLIRRSEEARLWNGMPTYQLMIFAVATLPSAVRIFASKGLGWTMGWAVIFFTDYLVAAMITFIGTSTPSQLRDSERFAAEHKKTIGWLLLLTDLIYWAAYILTGVCWMRIAKAILGQYTLNTIILAPSAVKGVRVGIFFGGLLVFGLTVYYWRLAELSRHRILCRFTALGLTLYTLALYVLFLLAFNDTFIASSTTAKKERPEKHKHGLVTAFLILGFPAVILAGVGSVLGTDTLFRWFGLWVRSEDDPFAFLDASRSHEHRRQARALRMLQHIPWVRRCFIHRHDEELDLEAQKKTTYMAYWYGYVPPPPTPYVPTSQPWRQDGIGPISMLPPSIRRVAAIAFAIINLAFAVTYYVIIYDPTGTWRPAWAEPWG